MSKFVAVAAFAAAGLGVATGTASAVEGVDGCISYSYEDGIAHTKVYYHNRCNTTQGVTIYPEENGCGNWTTRLAPDEKGNHESEFNCGVSGVSNIDG
ncbi:hypothetical protein BJY24_007266 [Nocardia transvalensis]|uniref:Uncharacterized protein n=1 Tax=Nocardia transvalensis TaxID=37333 RepID=A0A7W9PLG9_9NOCA|nr:hypothetical protein [Nocardia transvalensis]MBB5918354.1 hypothetical protein [Nocardia transvalensis]